jgi:hypothetical protein
LYFLAGINPVESNGWTKSKYGTPDSGGFETAGLYLKSNGSDELLTDG